MKYYKLKLYFLIFFFAAFLNACTAVSTFPTVARAGDTVSVMVGGTEKARKNTVSAILTDSNGQVWDLQALGLIRSVFNLRADGRAEGTHYSSYLESFISWDFGHEPVQTVLVTNIPVGAAVGNAVLTIDTFVDDNSSGVSSPFTVNIEILPGTGVNDEFLRQDAFGGELAVDFSRLEPAPHAKIDFGIRDNIYIGAASLIIDFDETVLTPGDINVFVPEATVRGNIVTTGEFGDKQRMVYWRQDGQKLFIDIVAPQGIYQAYLMLYVMHPRGLSASPGFSIISSTVYDTNGDEIVLTPGLQYFP